LNKYTNSFKEWKETQVEDPKVDLTLLKDYDKFALSQTVQMSDNSFMSIQHKTCLEGEYESTLESLIKQGVYFFSITYLPYEGQSINPEYQFSFGVHE
jgi:hypothetical protein